MRTSITHLPAQVQADLTYITEYLITHTKTRLERTGRRQTSSCIRYLLLHGCFTEDHWKPDTELQPDAVSYCYNIIVIISAHLYDIMDSLENAVAQLNQSGKVIFPVSIQIADTRGRISQKLRNGYLAYDQIQTRAIQLYSKGGTTNDLFERPNMPDVKEHYVQARNYYDHAFPLAELFLSGARSFEDRGERATRAGETQVAQGAIVPPTEYNNSNAAAFMLNLSAAQAYEALIVVHILRYPLGRPLNDLRELAESLHPELRLIWTGLRGEQVFDQLAKAFRDTRFSIKYHITDTDLELMFGYVEDLHKLVHHICRIKFDALKAGSLAKPNKDWLAVVREALKPPEDPMFDDEPETKEAINTAPSPIFRTPEQEEALEKLRTKIFDLEEPCFEPEQLGSVLKTMAHEDDDAELSGIFVMGRVVCERAHMIKDIFKQMVDLLRQTRIRDDDPAEGKSDLKNNKESTDIKEQKVA